jgi:hypothetical protein
MFGVKFSSSTSSSNWPPEPAASTVSPPNSCHPSNANRKLQHYPLHDRDKKFCASFRSALAAADVKPIMLPAKSPNLNAYAERWVRSVKQECLSKLVLFGEGPLQRSLTNKRLIIIWNAITRARTTGY